MTRSTPTSAEKSARQQWEADQDWLASLSLTLPEHVTNRSRTLALAALDDIDSEPRDEDRTYYMARWFHAALSSQDKRVEELEKALRKIAEHRTASVRGESPSYAVGWAFHNVRLIARAALTDGAADE
jgi:hypothetical protein